MTYSLSFRNSVILGIARLEIFVIADKNEVRMLDFRSDICPGQFETSSQLHVCVPMHENLREGKETLT